VADKWLGGQPWQGHAAPRWIGAPRTSAGCEKYSVWLNVPFTGVTAAAVSATHAGSCGGPVSGAAVVVGAGVVDGAAVFAPETAHQFSASTRMQCDLQVELCVTLGPVFH